MDNIETYDKAVEAIKKSFADALRNLMDPIKAQRLIKSNVSLQAYALAKALGEDIASPDLREIERQLQSDSYKQSMGEYFLAYNMAHNHDRLMQIVVSMGDNYYLYKDDDYQLMCRGFDMLPERMKDHISVMQLMQDNEVVKDVGYRYNDTHFYIYK
jgi:hypothetical protein